jgi:hypothetical protein
VPEPQAAVQVVMVPAATGVVVASVPTVFFVVAVAAHDPALKRLSVADVQVYVTPLAAPGMTVQAVHAPAFNQNPVLHDAALSLAAVVQVYVAALVVVVPQIVQTSLVPVPSLK